VANDVEVKVGADTRSAEASLDGLKSSLKSMQKIAAAAIAIFAGKQVVDFFGAGTEAAIAQEKSMAALGQQLKLSGEFSDEALQSFAAFADQMELTSQFGDDVVISQVAVAKAMGLTNEQSQKLVQAAIELSAATGDSLDASVQALGKTFDGITGKSPVLKNALQGISTEALKAGKGIDAVLSNLGGSSEAQIQTFSGALKQAENAFGNFQESFGKLIIENPALIAGIKAVSEGFRLLQATVEENGSSITNFITGAVQGLAVSISVAVDAIGFFIRAFQGLATITNLAVSGFLLIADVVGTALAESFGLAVTLVLKLSDALGTTQGAADKFEGFVAAQVEGLRKMTDETLKFAAENNESFESFNSDYEEFGKTVDGLAQKVFDANQKQVKSTQKLQVQTKKSFDLSAKDIEGLEKDFKSFYDKMLSNGTESIEGQLAAFESYLDEIERLQKSGVFGLEKINALRLASISNHEQKITEITKKLVEERQKEIQTILNNTNIFQQIKISLDKNSAEDVRKEIAKTLKQQAFDVAASAVGAVSNGAAGADAVSTLVTGLISKIPVIGGLIAEIVKLAAQAPEENKKNIQGFTKGIPEFLSNINTNLGSLTTILNEVIGPVIEKVLTSSGLGNLFTNLMKNIIKLPELIKTIAVGVRDGIRSSGGELANAFKKALSDTGAEATRFYDNAREFFGNFANGFREALVYIFTDNPILNELLTIKEGAIRIGLVLDFFKQILTSIPGAIAQIRDVLVGIGGSFFEAFENIGLKFEDGFLQLRDAVTNLFGSLFESIKSLPNLIKDAFSGLFSNIDNIFIDVKNNVQRIVDNIQDFLSKFSGGGGLSSASSGGNSILNKITGRAKGLTEVPPGFDNDGFLARLSSGERVVDSNANADLKEFLANAKSGGLNSAEAISLLRQIASQSSASVVQVVIDKKVLGSTILDLNRRNERING